MKKNLWKTYIFYFNSWYVWDDNEEEVEAGDIWITETTTEEHDNELLKIYYKDFLWNFDSWWYEKD